MPGASYTSSACTEGGNSRRRVHCTPFLSPLRQSRSSACPVGVTGRRGCSGWVLAKVPCLSVCICGCLNLLLASLFCYSLSPCNNAVLRACQVISALQHVFPLLCILFINFFEFSNEVLHMYLKSYNT